LAYCSKGLFLITRSSISAIRRLGRVKLLTTYEDDADVCRASKAGAEVPLVKGTDAQQFREAVRKVCRKGQVSWSGTPSKAVT